MPRCRDNADCDRGQSTVEFVLVLPVLVVALLLVVQVGLVVRDSLVIQDLAREAARAAAVDPRQSTVEQVVDQASDRLDSGRTSVALNGGLVEGELVTATVKYSAPTNIPIVGQLVGDIPLSASVTMRVE